MKPFLILGLRWDASAVPVVLSFALMLGGCNHESQIPSQPPKAVRLATVAESRMSAETLRYSASILPYAQVELMFRSSGGSRMKIERLGLGALLDGDRLPSSSHRLTQRCSR